MASATRFHFEKLFPGILFIFLGLFFLAQNSGWIPEAWTFDLWKLWPLLLIYIGLANLQLRRWLGVVIGILVALFTVALTGLFLLGIPERDENSQTTLFNLSSDSSNLEIEGQ